ncbi:MAG: phosphatase PAP2 family protein [Paramuribaculum sp.]|nr:phosphatase PAP2 family protein [Paramuribaculum sp.]
MKNILVVLMFMLCGFSTANAQTAVKPEAKHYYLDDIAQFVPTIANFGLSVCGVKPRHDWRERIALTATSMIICEGITFTLKHTIHSTRPDGTDRHSFPSGHAARAFRGAEMLRSEYGWAWGAGGYAVAIGVGALRIHHHRHRFGDVAAGAAIGILSARAAYLLLPVERRIFGWDRKRVTAIATPVYTPETRTFSLAAAVTF